jgi:carbamate kinase
VNSGGTKMTKIVVALGGNALGKSPAEQLELVKNTAASLAGLIAAGNKVVITHGNGPQVGVINLGLDFAAEHDKTPLFPFPECGAMSQGYIGYHLQQSLENEFCKRKLNKKIVSVITQTEVNANDQAFDNPTKPVGNFYSREESKKIENEKKFVFVEDAGRGYRRVVPSPLPKKIIEQDSINDLIDTDNLVIASGGGGVPVVKTEQGYQGVAAVIDKDMSAALLAANIEAEQLIILTAVDNVSLDYGKTTELPINRLTVKEAKQYISENQFSPGSMLPKIEACLEFVSGKKGRTALITSLGHLDSAIAGKIGTLICE